MRLHAQAARPTLGSCPTVCKPASLSLGSMDDAAAAHSNRKGAAWLSKFATLCDPGLPGLCRIIWLIMAGEQSTI